MVCDLPQKEVGSDVRGFCRFFSEEVVRQKLAFIDE